MIYMCIASIILCFLKRRYRSAIAYAPVLQNKCGIVLNEQCAMCNWDAILKGDSLMTIDN